MIYRCVTEWRMATPLRWQHPPSMWLQVQGVLPQMTSLQVPVRLDMSCPTKAEHSFSSQMLPVVMSKAVLWRALNQKNQLN